MHPSQAGKKSLTVKQLMARLKLAEVLDESQWTQAREIADQAEDGADARSLMKQLHKAGLLTAYQAQVLWSGKGQKLVLGNYVIEDELGRGGMGVVLKAHHKRMGRQVAVKILPAKMTRNQEAIARFQREVIAAAKLMHPNIVAAYDADHIGGQHLLVMEFVDGRDLSSVVKKDGALSVEQSIDCVLQAARGLEFAHRSGVVHRDIKPANLLLDSQGTVKILDMGLARLEESAGAANQAELTGTGAVMGTVDYMSPEQAISTKSADARSDLYSLGITLYFLLTGKVPYEADSLMGRLMAHQRDPIPKLQTIREDVPDSLQAVFEKMVAKSPEDRYQTMAEALRDLEACRSGSAVSVVMSVAPVTGDEAGFTQFLQSLDDPGITARSGLDPAGRSISSPSGGAGQSETLVSGSASGTLKSVQPSRRGRQPVTSWWRDLRALAAAAGTLLLLSAVVLLFRTDQGTLRVEINDPEVEVTVKANGLVLSGADSRDIELTAGDHRLHVKRGDFEFDTKEFALKRGETVVVSVQLVDGRIEVASQGRALGGRRIAKPADETRTNPDTSVVQTESKETQPSSATTSLATPPTMVDLTPKVTATEPQLRATQWVLSVRGTATIRVRGADRPILGIHQIPEEDFTLVGLEVVENGPNVQTLELDGIDTIEHLDLYRMNVTEEVIPLVKRFRKLSWLRVPHHGGDQWAAAVTTFPELKSLSFFRSSISAEGILQLRSLKQLEELSFGDTRVVDEDCLKMIGGLTQLRVLDLGNALAENCSLQHLQPSMNLERLMLWGTRLNDDDLKHLESFQSLKVLSLGTQPVSDAAIIRLQTALPKCEIQL